MTEGRNRETSRGGTEWSDTENGQLVDGLRRGWSVEELARAHSRSEHAVTRQVEAMVPAVRALRGAVAVGWLRARLVEDAGYDWRAELRSRRSRVYWSAEDDAALRAAWDAGEDLPAVADRFGLGEMAVHRRLVALKLSASEAETVQRMGCTAGSLLEARTRRQLGEQLEALTLLVVTGRPEGTGLRLSVCSSREGALAERDKLRRLHQSRAGGAGDAGHWIVAMRKLDGGGAAVFGEDTAGPMGPDGTEDLGG